MRHAAECAKFLEDVAGKVDSAGAFCARAQQNSQEFRITQSARAFLKQFLSWPVVEWP